MPPSLHDAGRTALLRYSTHLLLGLVVVVFALSLIEPGNDVRVTLALYVPFVALVLGIKRANATGRLQLASWSLTLLLLGFVALSIVLSGGLIGHSGVGFVLGVMVAGSLLGGRAALQTAAGVVLFCTAILWLQLHDRLPEPVIPESPLNSWLALSASLGLMAVLFHGTLLSLRSAIQDAENNARERDEAMQRFLTTQKMELVGQLTGGVAHDFNNLLTVVSGSVSTLRSELPRDSTEARDILRDIDAASARARRMIRLLLSFSRERTVGPLVPLDASRALHELNPLLPRLLGSAIEVRLHAPTPVTILASQTGLEQILLNLAVNAREAMPDGGLLTLHLSAEDTHAALVVEDTGVGMDAETRARIFEPFFSTREGGTGLGLATVDALVKQLRGTVTVESTPGVGTRFTVTFPRDTASR